MSKNKGKSKKKAHANNRGKREPGAGRLGMLPGSRTTNIPNVNRSSLGILGVKPSLRETLGWTGAAVVATSANTFAELATIILNSPFDPDNALGGISARGYAKLMALYSKCFTIGATIKVQILGGDNPGLLADNVVQMAGVTITTNTTALTSLVQAQELGYTEHQFLGLSPDHHEFNLRLDVADFLNKPDVLDDAQLFCTSSANPAQLIVAHIWISNLAAATSGGVAWNANVNYEVVFTDPIPFT